MDLKKQAENLKEVGAIALDLIKETDWKAFAAKQKDHLLDNVARVAARPRPSPPCLARSAWIC